MNNSQIKEIVKEKYGQLASQTISHAEECSCGTDCGCNSDEITIMQDDYSKIEGYVPDADLNLGCGIPTEYANIKQGDTLLDLGSGAGNDAFIARRIVGEGGKVIGIDMTEKMVEKARQNCNNLGYDNVEFRFGDIENLPVDSEKVDVIISNCVLNLVPNKDLSFSEMYRTLKPGAHFCVSDIVMEGELPEQLKHSAELYVGCIAGALQKTDYLNLLSKAGFNNIEIKKEKSI